MKVRKICTQEIIECETTGNPNVYIKRQFTLDQVFKKEKPIDINKQRIGQKFMVSAEKALNYLVNNLGYELVEN